MTGNYTGAEPDNYDDSTREPDDYDEVVNELDDEQAPVDQFPSEDSEKNNGVLGGLLSPFGSNDEIDDEGQGIPGSKLENWSKPGPSKNTKETCDSIKRALQNDRVLSEKNIEFRVYIQGSYKNSTNIHGDSDVDIVVQLDAPYRLEDKNGTVKIVHPDGSVPDYDYHQFKADVVKALKRRYGEGAVTIGDKAIEVHSSESSLRIDADVVVAQQYSNESAATDKPGIWFETRSGRTITNYPKQHYENGAAKNKRTNGEYKKTLRMFKRARRHLANKGRISKDAVPGYFLECLLYNVPDRVYTQSDPDSNIYQSRYCEVVNYLQQADLERYQCQNEIHQLFGTESTQWNEPDANRFISELTYLWQNWY